MANEDTAAVLRRIFAGLPERIFGITTKDGYYGTTTAARQ